MIRNIEMELTALSEKPRPIKKVRYKMKSTWTARLNLANGMIKLFGRFISTHPVQFGTEFHSMADE